MTITNNDILSNTEGMKSDNYFDFNVSLEKQTTTGVSYNILLTSDNTNNLSNIKAYLTEVKNNTETKLIDPTTLNNLTKVNNNMKLYSDIIDPNKTKYYRLRLWVDENFGSSQTTSVNGNTSTGTITGFTFKFVVSIGVDNTNVEKPIPATDTLIALTNNQNDSGLYTITHPADSTLQIGATESITEYRYRGASPKNYVNFNGETWRIIGIFPTDDGNGNIENRIKLIRNESIGNYYWDLGTTAYNYNNYNVIFTAADLCYGENNWAKPATLNTSLNGTYYNGLSSTAQNMIKDAKYYLGGYNSYSPTPVDMYSYERKIQNTTSNEFYYGTNPNSWIGKIGLMYVSDYGYASDACETKKLADTSTTDLRVCNTTNWLYNIISSKTYGAWVLNNYTATGSSFAGRTSYVLSNLGNFYSIQTCGTGSELQSLPVLYLNPDVNITDGDGTSSNPYVFSL